MRWRSPYDPPPQTCSNARRVVVWLENNNNPPELNVPGKIAFGHHISAPEGNEHWPGDGWFFDGQQDYLHVAAWAYCDPPTHRELENL